MNPTPTPITTEELLTLTKSADLLRQTAEKAMRCDSLARELHQAKVERDAWNAVADRHYREVHDWKERYQKEVASLKQVRDSLDSQLKNLRQSYGDAVSKIESLRTDKNYAEEHLTHLAKFLGLNGMTWAHVVSEAVSMIERQKQKNASLSPGKGALHDVILQARKKIGSVTTGWENLSLHELTDWAVARIGYLERECDKLAKKAAQFDEAERLLTEHIESWKHIQEAMPEPDINDTPEPPVKRVVRRLGLEDSLKKELGVVGNHAICRINVLGEIHRILGSDGGPTGVCELTGVPPQLYRLPKRVEQLVGELHGTRNDRDHLAGILEKVARACDGDDPLDFPQLPQKVAGLAKEAAQCQQWRDEFVKAENKANRAEERANCTGLQVIALLQELGDAVSLKNQLDARIGELLRENETLARNMPPEPPVNPQPTDRVTEVIGQQGCKTDRHDLRYQTLSLYPTKGYLVLCEVHQDVQTGALTYHPVAVKDLPLVP